MSSILKDNAVLTQIFVEGCSIYNEVIKFKNKTSYNTLTTDKKLEVLEPFEKTLKDNYILIHIKFPLIVKFITGLNMFNEQGFIEFLNAHDDSKYNKAQYPEKAKMTCRYIYYTYLEILKKRDKTMLEVDMVNEALKMEKDICKTTLEEYNKIHTQSPYL